MKQSHVFLLLILSVLALMVTACSEPAPPPEVRIGHAPHDHHSPLYVAAMNPEYFKKNGGVYLREVVFKKEYELVDNERSLARVLIDSSTGGKELIRKLSENIFDMSFGGVPAMLSFIDKGTPIRIVAPAMAEGGGLVVGKNIEAGNWQEFLAHIRASPRPVRIGYKTAVSVQNLIFEAALRDSGISYSTKLDEQQVQVVLVNLHGPKNLLPALRDQLIDGFVVMQPYLALAEEEGVGRAVAMFDELPPQGRWEGNPCCAIAASTTFVDHHPEVAESMTRLMLRANRRITEEPQKSAGQIAQWLGLSARVEERSIPTIQFTLDFDAAWQRGVDFWVQSMVQGGTLNDKVKDAYHSGKLDGLVYDMELYTKARQGI